MRRYAAVTDQTLLVAAETVSGSDVANHLRSPLVGGRP